MMVTVLNTDWKMSAARKSHHEFFVLCNLWRVFSDVSNRNDVPVNLEYVIKAVKAILQRLKLLLILGALTEDISGLYQNGAIEGALRGKRVSTEPVLNAHCGVWSLCETVELPLRLCRPFW